MKHRVNLGMEKWSANTRNLPALKVGQHVNIQNQHWAGKIAKRWGSTNIESKLTRVEELQTGIANY